MNLLIRLTSLLVLVFSFSAPAGAAVDADFGGHCGVVAADEAKGGGKQEGDKKEDEEEPDCE